MLRLDWGRFSTAKMAVPIPTYHGPASERPRDAKTRAFQIVQEATWQAPPEPEELGIYLIQVTPTCTIEQACRASATCTELVAVVVEGSKLRPRGASRLFSTAKMAVPIPTYHGPASERPRDAKTRAFQIVQEATWQAPPEPEDTRNPAAVALSKLGASQGARRGRPSSVRDDGERTPRKLPACVGVALSIRLWPPESSRTSPRKSESALRGSSQ